MTKKHVLLVIASWLFASPISGGDTTALPPPFELTFQVTRSGFHVATIEQRLTWFDDNTYHYRSATRTTPWIALFKRLDIVEESWGQSNKDRLQPLRYRYRRLKGKDEHKKMMGFDWQAGEAQVVVDGQTSKQPLEEGMLDKLLYQIQIMRDLAQGLTPLSYTVLDGTRRKVYELAYPGEERIQTPLGEFTTQRVVRHRRDGRETVMLWCAIELSYLPIKVITIDKAGKKTVAMIESLAGLEKSIANDK